MSEQHEGGLAFGEVERATDFSSEKRTAALAFGAGIWDAAMKIATGAVVGAGVGALPAVITGQPAYVAIAAGVGGILGVKPAASKHKSWSLSRKSPTA